MNKIAAPFIVGAPTPSPCYFGCWPGIQISTDGRSTIQDISGKGRHLVVGSDTSYATATANAGYTTITGAPSGANKRSEERRGGKEWG